MSYLKKIKVDKFPRIPLKGSIDLTYRCNNNCRHCWVRIPPDSDEKEKELSFEEIRKIVDEAKKSGCRRWSISGGEPLLREDFKEIFDYITRNSLSYTLNTNGALITPQIARLLKRKGAKLIALYGATPQVHNHITRTPGSFEAVMRGFSYLKEAGASFIVQLIIMKDNYHQLEEMIRLAESLSPWWRFGASWLYLSAYNDKERNQEIINQRLPASLVVELDKPDLCFEEWYKNERKEKVSLDKENDNYLFKGCIENRRDFHIDPYGKMSFCSYIKDPQLRYDLRKGSFKEAWEEFIPSLRYKVKAEEGYKKTVALANSERIVNDVLYMVI